MYLEMMNFLPTIKEECPSSNQSHEGEHILVPNEVLSIDQIRFLSGVNK